jgi:hypothetical protein
MAKDPYCEVYKVVFARAESYAQEILRRYQKRFLESPLTKAVLEYPKATT